MNWGGITRSSVEVTVMVMEPRGYAKWSNHYSTENQEEIIERDKII